MNSSSSSSSSSWRSIPTVDRISDMPDSILCHILSFHPTKFAATTSVLSKRWKLVWIAVLVLDFDQEAFNSFKSFKEFVSLTFRLRDKKSSIHSFTLKCGESSRFTQRDWDKFFKFVMERGVEYLNFDMSGKKCQIKLPPCFLDYTKTLEVLKLSNVQMRDFEQVNFPRLKILQLNHVFFKSRENSVKFLLGCPILEDLQTELALPILLKTISDSNAQISREEEMLLTSHTRLPMFHNLTHMKLSIHTRSWGWECSSLLGILSHFPKLEHFKIQDCATATLSCKCWIDPVTTFPATVPECLSSQLKTCYIRGYRDSKWYCVFAKYIVQHSKVLETMTIKTSFLAKNQKFLRILSSSTRGSPNCKLLFD